MRRGRAESRCLYFHYVQAVCYGYGAIGAVNFVALVSPMVAGIERSLDQSVSACTNVTWTCLESGLPIMRNDRGKLVEVRITGAPILRASLSRKDSR